MVLLVDLMICFSRKRQKKPGRKDSIQYIRKLSIKFVDCTRRKSQKEFIGWEGNKSNVIIMES